MGESSQCNPNNLYNLDEEFYKYMREIKLIIPELNPKGVMISQELNYFVVSKRQLASMKRGVFSRVKQYFTLLQRLQMYKTLIRPVMEFCSHIFDDAPEYQLTALEFVKQCAVKLIDRGLLNRWLIKLTGTHGLRRNDYLRFLLNHLSTTGELNPLFSEPPHKYDELVPLDEALFGPRPDTVVTKRAWRAERVAPVKKRTPKELKEKYGTDRAAIHNCVKDLKDTDQLTVQGLVGLVRPHTKDEGAELTDVMLTELNEFRVAVDNYYDNQTRFISEKLAIDQAQLKTDFAKQVTSLKKERDNLIAQLQEQDPTFDWQHFRKEYKITSENKRRIKKLRREVGDKRRRNLKIWDAIEELTNFASGQDSAQCAPDYTYESMGLLDKDELSDTYLT